MRRVDAKLEMSTARTSALSVLVFRGPCSLSTLAEIEQVSKPTISNLVRALERDGYVRCRPDRSDGRVVIVSASARGRRLLEKGQAARIDLLLEMTEGLTESEVASLKNASAAIEKILDSR